MNNIEKKYSPHHGFSIVGKTTIVLLVASLTSCLPFPVHVQSHVDVADGSRMVMWQHRETGENLNTPLRYVDQSFLKRVQPSGVVNYQLFDVIVMQAGQFEIEEPVNLLLDGEVIRLQVRKREVSMQAGGESVDRTNVTEANRSVILPVTGDQLQVTRFQYDLSEEIAVKLKSANIVRFQYKSGPYLMTIQVDHDHNQKIKEWIALTPGHFLAQETN